MQPRYLFRRLIALFIDWTMAAIFTLLLLYPFVRGHTDQIRYSGNIISGGSHQNSSVAPKQLHELNKSQPISALTIYTKKPFFLFENGLTAKLDYGTSQKKYGPVTVKTGTSITVPINNYGIPVYPVYPQIS